MWRMLTRSDRLEYELNKLVDKQIDALKEVLAAGMLEDHAQYKHKCGQIDGLRMLKDILEEARSICEGREY